ncbi:hypothetical protein Taro_008180, partial [Colocasia esculenta]|nr:hypothetical protein [Colocasia esculenta]
APYPDPPPVNGPKFRKGYLIQVSSKNIKDNNYSIRHKKVHVLISVNHIVQLSQYIITCLIKKYNYLGHTPREHKLTQHNYNSTAGGTSMLQCLCKPYKRKALKRTGTTQKQHTTLKNLNPQRVSPETPIVKLFHAHSIYNK